MHTTSNTVNNNPFISDVPFHLGWLLRPKQPIKQNITANNIHKKNKILTLISRKIHHFKKASCQKHFKDRINHSFKIPELGDLIDKGNFIHKYLPKQTDIDKILEVIQRKVLRGTHLPKEIKEIQAGYLCSPYFRDLYLYLSQNKLPSLKPAIKKLEALAERYVLLDS